MRSIRAIIGMGFLATALFVAFPVDAKKTSSTSSASACASELPTVQTTGVAAFDDVFNKAGAILTSLGGTCTELNTSRTNFNTALGISTDSPMKTALEDLKTKASGAVTVAMNGTVPSLAVQDAAPENVKSAVTAANGLITASGNAVTTLTGLQGQATELVSAVTAFPAQIPSLGLDPKTLLSTTGKVKSNIGAIGKIPGLITSITGEITNFFNDIKSVFTG